MGATSPLGTRDPEMVEKGSKLCPNLLYSQYQDLLPQKYDPPTLYLPPNPRSLIRSQV